MPIDLSTPKFQIIRQVESGGVFNERNGGIRYISDAAVRRSYS
jgi:hypothetical protein